MFGIGSQELMVILLVVFLIFGAKRLPELGGSLGQAIRGFKKGMEGSPNESEPHQIHANQSLDKR